MTPPNVLSSGQSATWSARVTGTAAPVVIRWEFGGGAEPNFYELAVDTLNPTVTVRMINNARDINDMRVPPGNRLEALKGDRAGQHSVRINQQWRICFRWHDGDAYDIEIVDYH